MKYETSSSDSSENAHDFLDLLRWFDAVNAGNITIEVIHLFIY